ncbi:hypothetical protein JB92DRAFT_2708202 [Gautieria morchelliformis]|nr:hypothetical protein JB92DRAFT_2708202 [Gautieria morchelliformis]
MLRKEDIKHVECTIYALTATISSVMEVTVCTRCPPRSRRCCGPDLGTLGLFNYNNHMVFTHELLDEYTSAYTLAESPFSGWTVGIARRYQTNGSHKPFVTDDLFRQAWFAYVHLQPWTSPHTCPVCGPSPIATIWDGITLAYSKTHLLPSLQPPTMIGPEAPQRPTR